jgi:iron complex transport system substrate-binding protein
MLKNVHFILPGMAIILLLIPASGAVLENAQYPLEITDASGNTVIIEEKPQRIISTMPSNTEMLFAIGAGKYIVGSTIHDTYPPEAEETEKIGGYVTLDIEKIIDLEPDLVVAGSDNGEENINIMRDELGMNVIILDSRNLDEIMENIELLGVITNNTANATSVTAGMRQKIEDIAEDTATIPEDVRPRVLYVVWDDPMYAAGNNTFPNDLIAIAGGKNIMSTDGWLTVDPEDALDKDPEIIICSSMGENEQSVSEELAGKIRSNELLAHTSAVQNNRIYPISDPNLIERSGPRIVQGLEELYRIVEPVTEEKIQEIEGSAEKENNTQDSPGFGILLTCAAILSLFIFGKIRK